MVVDSALNLDRSSASGKPQTVCDKRSTTRGLLLLIDVEKGELLGVTRNVRVALMRVSTSSCNSSQKKHWIHTRMGQVQGILFDACAIGVLFSSKGAEETGIHTSMINMF